MSNAISPMPPKAWVKHVATFLVVLFLGVLATGGHPSSSAYAQTAAAAAPAAQNPNSDMPDALFQAHKATAKTYTDALKSCDTRYGTGSLGGGGGQNSGGTTARGSCHNEARRVAEEQIYKDEWRIKYETAPPQTQAKVSDMLNNPQKYVAECTEAKNWFMDCNQQELNAYIREKSLDLLDVRPSRQRLDNFVTQNVVEKRAEVISNSSDPDINEKIANLNQRRADGSITQAEYDRLMDKQLKMNPTEVRWEGDVLKKVQDRHTFINNATRAFSFGQIIGGYLEFIFDYTIKFAVDFYHILSAPVKSVLIYGLAIYLVFQLARAFMPFGPMLDAQGWSMIVWRFILAIFIFAILASPGFFWDWIVTPIMSVGTYFMKVIYLGMNGTPDSMLQALRLKLGLSFPVCGAGFTPATLLHGIPDIQNSLNSLLGLRSDMSCYVATIIDPFARLISTSFSATWTDVNESSTLFGWLSGDAIVKAIIATLQTFMILILAAVLFFPIVVVAITFFDTILRIGFTALTAPFAFALALFPKTRGVFVNAFMSIIRSASMLMFLSIGVALGLKAFEIALSSYFDLANLKNEIKVNYASTSREHWARWVGGGAPTQLRCADYASSTAEFKDARNLPGLFTALAAGQCFESIGAFFTRGYWLSLLAGIFMFFMVRFAKGYSERFIDSIQQGGKEGMNLAGSAVKNTLGAASIAAIGGAMVGMPILNSALNLFRGTVGAGNRTGTAATGGVTGLASKSPPPAAGGGTPPTSPAGAGGGGGARPLGGAGQQTLPSSGASNPYGVQPAANTSAGQGQPAGAAPTRATPAAGGAAGGAVTPSPAGTATPPSSTTQGTSAPTIPQTPQTYDVKPAAPTQPATAPTQQPAPAKETGAYELKDTPATPSSGSTAPRDPLVFGPQPKTPPKK